MHERLTKDHPRHPHTGLPDGFHGFPAGVCPWCSGPNGTGEEGCDPQYHVRHGGPCPRVQMLELNEHGGIHRLKLGPPYHPLGSL
ncbi:MAG TPA: hypothetical protein VJS20_12805 [Gemmatimonadales bacterium]|nr:hypothetical protein [Gemmatimonadales bacterium]